MKLYPQGICEICGMSGQHPECEARAQRMFEQQRAADAVLLARHALFGAYGVHSPESETSLAIARSRLETYLTRAATFDPARCVEAAGWWFLPEGWIGMIGFIVEKSTGAVIPLGSGIVGLYNGPHLSPPWIAISYYLDGKASETKGDCAPVQ